MMGQRDDRMRSAWEYDAFTAWKRFCRWRAGLRSAIKRKFRRRERQVAKRVLERAE